jgi:hypothetical protein
VEDLVISKWVLVGFLIVVFFVLGPVMRGSGKFFQRMPWLWGVIAVLGLGSVVLMYGPYRLELEALMFQHVECPISSVESGNQFTIRGMTIKRRHFVLTDTQLPEGEDAEAESRTALEDRLKRKYGVIRYVGECGEPPCEVRLLVKKTDIGEEMVQQGHLVGIGSLAATRPAVSEPAADGGITTDDDSAEDGTQGVPVADAADDDSAAEAAHPDSATTAPEEAALPEATEATEPEASAADGDAADGDAAEQAPVRKIPRWRAILRWPGWIMLGFIGATALGQLLNRRFQGLVTLLPIAGWAIYAIVRSVQIDVSFVPPLITLIMIVLLGPRGAKANEKYLADKASKS